MEKLRVQACGQQSHFVHAIGAAQLAGSLKPDRDIAIRAAGVVHSLEVGELGLVEDAGDQSPAGAARGRIGVGNFACF